MTSRYYEAQITACSAILERLHSIAIQAVQGQNEDPSGYRLMDLLGDMQRDIDMAVALNSALNFDRVYIAEEMAKTGIIRKYWNNP